MNLPSISYTNETEPLQRMMTDKFLNMEKQISDLKELLQVQKATKKGKGKGKKSQNQTSQLPLSEIQSTSAESQARLEAYIQSTSNQTNYRQEGLRTSHSDTRRREDVESSLMTEDQVRPNVGVKKTVYLKRIDCQLNTNSIDQGI